MTVKTALLVCTFAFLAHGAVINDPANDFLASFTGPHNGDLDVLSAQAVFNGSSFTFWSMQNGAIGTTPDALFVWGVDRGTHDAPFGAFRPGVLFDAVVILRPDMTGTVVDFSTGPPTMTNLAPGSVTISGNTIQGVVPASLLLSTGSPQMDFGVNLWPRTGLGNNALIADFAPDNSDARVAATPEPEAALLIMSGLGSLALLRRRIHRC